MALCVKSCFSPFVKKEGITAFILSSSRYTNESLNPQSTKNKSFSSDQFKTLFQSRYHERINMENSTGKHYNHWFNKWTTFMQAVRFPLEGSNHAFLNEDVHAAKDKQKLVPVYVGWWHPPVRWGRNQHFVEQIPPKALIVVTSLPITCLGHIKNGWYVVIVQTRFQLHLEDPKSISWTANWCVFQCTNHVGTEIVIRVFA